MSHNTDVSTVYPGAAAASRLFNDALAKIAVNAQQGGTTDIGKCYFIDDIVLLPARGSNDDLHAKRWNVRHLEESEQQMARK